MSESKTTLHLRAQAPVAFRLVFRLTDGSVWGEQQFRASVTNEHSIWTPWATEPTTLDRLEVYLGDIMLCLVDSTQPQLPYLLGPGAAIELKPGDLKVTVVL